MSIIIPLALYADDMAAGANTLEELFEIYKALVTTRKVLSCSFKPDKTRHTKQCVRSSFANVNGTGQALPSLEATHAIAASTIRGGRDLHVSSPGNRREVMCGTRTPSLNARSAKPCLNLHHSFF
jgi:hypothetical protein